MKGFRYALVFGLLLGSIVVHAQTVQIRYEPRKVDFPEPSYSVFVPGNYQSTPGFRIISNYAEDNKSVVFKTPVCYTAFFCKMEVTTQKAMGIMIKVHAGDYDSYMDQKIPR